VNHSCCGNTQRSFIGDVFILRAARDIPADNELTFPYIDRCGNASSRAAANLHARLRENWGFICDCARCADVVHGRTPRALLEQRDKLLSEAQAGIFALTRGDVPVPDPPGMLAAEERRAELLAATYTNAGNSPPTTMLPPRDALVVAHAGLARVWFEIATEAFPSDHPGRRQFACKAIAAAVAALRAGGFVIRGSGIGVGVAGDGEASEVPLSMLATLPTSDAPPSLVAARAGARAAVAAAAASKLKSKNNKKNEIKGRNKATAAGSAAKASGAGTPPPPPPPPVEHALVIEEWGYVTPVVFIVLPYFIKAYIVARAPANLMAAVKAFARTLYTIMIGEEVTFDNMWTWMTAA
jgi:hypothetical protein